MRKKFIEAFGWYGTVAIVSAYALVSFSALVPTSIWYQLLNGTGALGIVAISLYKRAYQPGVLNIIWSIIAVIAILKIIF
jgi:hypothetical protein